MVNFNLAKLGVGVIVIGVLFAIAGLAMNVYYTNQAQNACLGFQPTVCSQQQAYANLGGTVMWIGIAFAILGGAFIALGFKFPPDPEHQRERAKDNSSGSSAAASPVAQTTVVLSGLGGMPQVSSSQSIKKCGSCGQDAGLGKFCQHCGAKVD